MPVIGLEMYIKNQYGSDFLAELICPITHALLEEPVSDEYGYTYSKAAIEKWLKKSDRNPMTNQKYKNQAVVPNRVVQKLLEKIISEIKEKHPNLVSLDEFWDAVRNQRAEDFNEKSTFFEEYLEKPTLTTYKNGASLACSPLYDSCVNGRLDWVRLLLASGAAVDTRITHSSTALMSSVYNDQYEITKILLKAGADPNAATNSGTNSLHYAARIGSVKIMKLLLAHNGNQHLTGPLRWSLLHYAAHHGKESVCKYLLENCNIDCNLRTSKGKTALHLAVAGGNRGIVQILLKAGADKDIKDLEGRTAFDLARKKHPTLSIELLLNTGSKTNSPDFRRLLSSLKALKDKDFVDAIQLMCSSHTKSLDSLIQSASRDNNFLLRLSRAQAQLLAV